MIESTQIIFGPGRFVPAGHQFTLSPWEEQELINQGKARRIETSAKPPAPENAQLPVPSKTGSKRK